MRYHVPNTTLPPRRYRGIRFTEMLVVILLAAELAHIFIKAAGG